MKTKKFHYAWLILIACCALQAGALGILVNCSGIFFTPVCAELGFGRGDLALYGSLQMLGMAVSLPIAGKLFPKKDMRLLVTGGYLLCIIPFALMSTFTALYQWYIGGIVMGLGAGFVFLSPAPLMISNWFKKKTGMAMGVAMAFSGVGGAILNPVGTAFIQNYGWRTAYLLLAVVSAVIVLPFTIFVIRYSPQRMGLKPYGEEQGGEGAQASDAPKALSGVKSARAFKSTAFLFVCLTMALVAYAPQYGQYISSMAAAAGLTAAVGATLMSSTMLGNIIGKLLLGAVNDKLGARTATLMGMFAGFASLVLMIFFMKNVPIMIVATFLYGFTMSNMAVGVPLVVRSIFGSRDYSAIFSTIGMVTSVLSAAGIFAIGKMYDIFGSFTQPLIFGCILSAASILLLFASFKAGSLLKPHFDEQ